MRNHVWSECHGGNTGECLERRLLTPIKLSGGSTGKQCCLRYNTRYWEIPGKYLAMAELTFRNIKVPVERVLVFFYIIRRVHPKQLHKLLPEIFDVTNTYLHRCLGDGIVFLKE